jgi:O-antigen ligase
VTTPGRLRTFLFWLTVFATVAVTLAVLDYREVITIPRPPPPPGKLPPPPPSDPNYRLVGTGIFQDPNDVCILVVVGIIFSLYWLTERSAGLARFLWAGPLALFAYAFALTQSRGGLLALLAGVGVLVRVRLGWFRTLALAAVGLPVLLVVLGARQTAISTSTPTGQTRIQVWSDGLMLFREAPLFGVGTNNFDQFSDHVAHNSYLQAFAEMGFFGGLCFLGVVYAPLAGLYRLGRGGRQLLQPELRRLHPFLLGAVVAWAVGMMTLTLTYLMPTYAMAGLAGVFLPMAVAWPPAPAERLDLRLLARLAVGGVCFLVGMFIFVRLSFGG